MQKMNRLVLQPRTEYEKRMTRWLPILFVFFAVEANADFVRVSGDHFEIAGRPYRFVGANFWQAMNLGAEDRPRLIRELDRLVELGVKNLRIMAATEGPDSEPWRVAPAIQTNPGVFRPKYLEGLDFLLVEMAKRDMRAVVTLNNFWNWSGGMAQYLNWFGYGAIPYPPPHPGGDWNTFQKYAQKFYSDEKAVGASHELIRKLVTRVNTITGKMYLDDPAIMAWQLANEPRGVGNAGAFNRWIEKTAALIKSLDRNHLVSTGTEGETPYPFFAGMDFVKNHSYRDIDYMTAHIWVENWGWYDPENAEKTYAKATASMKEYLLDHHKKARKLGKPLVLEEFGIARDLGSRDPESPATQRDRYYREVFALVDQLAQEGGPRAGVNFWAWAGEGRPRENGGYWRAGDSLIGDPPHESQGWYSVYDRDRSTHRVISEFARKLSRLR
jgi:mannan endo-1,4-beta-mannosidase